MIFSRKYIFEGKATRLRRVLLNASLALLIGGALYITLLVYMLMVAKTERARLAEGLFQKNPDAIVVFTGDRGRIARGLELVKKWPEARLLISGVHGANTLKTIVEGQTDAQALLDSSTQVDLDYEALDTMGNVREAIDRLSSGTQRVVIVTSDYHVLRVRLIFGSLEKTPFTVFFDGISTDGWSSWVRIKKLMLESVKIVRVGLILAFS